MEVNLPKKGKHSYVDNDFFDYLMSPWFYNKKCLLVVCPPSMFLLCNQRDEDLKPKASIFHLPLLI